jgi:hypothetical protein
MTVVTATQFPVFYHILAVLARREFLPDDRKSSLKFKEMPLELSLNLWYDECVNHDTCSLRSSILQDTLSSIHCRS